MSHMDRTECWDIFEVALQGPSQGNPFLDVTLSAAFSYKHRTIEVDGFYDGDGVYRVRFRPDASGEWRFVTSSNRSELNGRSGTFTCTDARRGNRGPVQVKDRFHFAYADGTVYSCVGTTSYAWAHQDEALQEQTLATLRASPFNKLRMLVFPKFYDWNTDDPQRYAFEPAPAGADGPHVGGRDPYRWDFGRFDVVFWRQFETRVRQLRDMGIEADIILLHPYDRWGFANMPVEVNERYLRYAIARLGACRNVWWSLANEWDLFKTRTPQEWQRYGRFVQERDPCQNPRSIHSCFRPYDHTQPWITHASIQHFWSPEGRQMIEWREQYNKPIVIDENRYEGNMPQDWGCISAREMVHRFWVAAIGGGYNGHSEAYLHPQDIIWWSKGGTLHGESHRRLAFLRRIVEEGPPTGFTSDGWPCWCARKGEDVILWYGGVYQPAEVTLNLPDGHEYRIEMMDPWEMTVAPLPGTFRGRTTVSMPARPYLAVRAIRTGTSTAV